METNLKNFSKFILDFPNGERITNGSVRAGNPSGQKSKEIIDILRAFHPSAGPKY